MKRSELQRAIDSLTAERDEINRIIARLEQHREAKRAAVSKRKARAAYQQKPEPRRVGGEGKLS